MQLNSYCMRWARRSKSIVSSDLTIEMVCRLIKLQMAVGEFERSGFGHERKRPSHALKADVIISAAARAGRRPACIGTAQLLGRLLLMSSAHQRSSMSARISCIRAAGRAVARVHVHGYCAACHACTAPPCIGSVPVTVVHALWLFGAGVGSV